MVRASKPTFSPAITSAATLRLVGGLVGEHRAADDVADGVDPGHVGLHLVIDGDEPALVDGHASGGGLDRAPVGHPADGHQHLIEHPRADAPDLDLQPVLLRLDGFDARPELGRL